MLDVQPKSRSQLLTKSGYKPRSSFRALPSDR